MLTIPLPFEASQSTYVSKLAVRNFGALPGLKGFSAICTAARMYVYYGAGDTVVTYCQL